MCVYIAGMEGTEGLGLRSVQGYHYWPPCCVSVTPWPWILTFKPTTTPVRAGLGWVDGIPCGDHQSQHTHIRSPFGAYFTPNLLLLILPHGKRRGKGWEWGCANDKGANRATESDWRSGVDKKKTASRLSGMSTPLCVFFWSQMVSFPPDR